MEWYNGIKSFFSSARGKDLLLYLTFVVISAIFWAILTLGNSVQTHFKVRLKIDEIPKGVTLLSDYPSEMDVSVKNTGYAFFRYMVGATPEIRVNFNTYADGNGNFVITRQNMEDLLRESFGKDTGIDTFTPDQLKIRYTTQPGKKVPVELVCDFQPALQYVVTGSKLSPDSVVIYADAENLSVLTRVTTAKALRHNLKESADIKVGLVRINDVRMQPDSVMVHIDVEALASKEHDVEIVTRNCPQGSHLVAFPATVKVEYLMPLSLYKRADSPRPVVYIDYNDIRQGQKKLPVHIEKSAVLQNISVVRDSVEYIIE